MPGSSKSRMLAAATRGPGAMMVAIAAVANTGSGSGAPAPSETASEGARAECAVLRGASGTPVRSPEGAVRNTLDGKGGGSRTHASSSSERVTLAWAKTDELRCYIFLIGSVGHTVAVLVPREHVWAKLPQ